MRRIIHVPIGFLETLSPKTLAEVQEKARTFSFEGETNYRSFHADGIGDNYRANIKHRSTTLDKLVVEHEGFYFEGGAFVEKETQAILNLEKASRELEQLKKSIAVIKETLK